jgi:hypothetical protein
MPLLHRYLFFTVIPAQVGIQQIRAAARIKTHVAADAALGLDSRLRGNDGWK